MATLTPMRLALRNFCMGACMAASSGAVAQWNADPAINSRVCTAALAQDSLAACTDGNGGAIAVWRDKRDGTDQIYAQRINSSGITGWADNGISICTTANAKSLMKIASDGVGGALVAWRENRTGITHIFAQRVDAQGTLLWGASGAQVMSIPSWSTMFGPVIDSDGQGGAIVTWSDNRGLTNDSNLYAQRLSAAGSTMWTDNGVTVCNAQGTQTFANVLGLGGGDSMIAWVDGRVSGVIQIYVQRLDSLGAPQWAPNGTLLCGAAGTRGYPHAVTDGAGGAIVAWEDFRSGQGSVYADIYTRKIGALGVPQWTPDGVPVCTAADVQQFALTSARPIVADGAGGAVLAWHDYRTSETNSYDVYAQRINSSGTVLWPINGLGVISGATGLPEVNPAVAADGGGHFVFSWTDVSLGLALGTEDVFAHKVSGVGAHGVGGRLAVSTAAQAQNSALLVPSVPGAVIALWHDTRNGNLDIYASRIGAMPNSLISDWNLYY